MEVLDVGEMVLTYLVMCLELEVAFAFETVLVASSVADIVASISYFPPVVQNTFCKLFHTYRAVQTFLPAMGIFAAAHLQLRAQGNIL